VKLRGQDRTDRTHNLGIKAVDENNQPAQGSDGQLEPAYRLLIDELADVEYGGLFQSGVNISGAAGVWQWERISDPAKRVLPFIDFEFSLNVTSTQISNRDFA
jgi:hypothetical protein